MAKETIQKDVVIIGAGMAGLTAALYAGRMNFSTLVLENAIVGGQIANATGIENYPGFLSVSGSSRRRRSAPSSTSSMRLRRLRSKARSSASRRRAPFTRRPSSSSPRA